jgi:hypothetical protein
MRFLKKDRHGLSTRYMAGLARCKFGEIYNVLLVRSTSGGVGPHRWNVNPQAADKSSDVLMVDQGVAQGLHINHNYIINKSDCKTSYDLSI